VVTRSRILAACFVAIGMAGGFGCGPTLPPLVEKPAPPPRPTPEEAQRAAASKFQRDIVMGEVARTHPVLAATLDRDLTRLQAAIKARGNVNEIRKDMHLGPPLREACRIGWKDGIEELRKAGAKCLGDPRCESCVRESAPSSG
jgi:hypothetical protein